MKLRVLVVIVFSAYQTQPYQTLTPTPTAAHLMHTAARWIWLKIGVSGDEISQNVLLALPGCCQDQAGLL